MIMQVVGGGARDANPTITRNNSARILWCKQRWNNYESRIEKPRNPENRKTNRRKIGTFYFLPIFLLFPQFFQFFADLSSYFLDLGVFLFCSWPTQLQDSMDSRPEPPEFFDKMKTSDFTLNLLIFAHQNRTIAIASDFRVDGAKSPEIPQNEGVWGSEIAAQNRKSLAIFHCNLKSQCSR